MENQKQSTLDLVAAHRGQGRRVSAVLSSLGVARSNYYRWKKDETPNKADRQSSYEVTAEERGQIDEVKANTRSTATGAFRVCCNSEGSIYRRR